MQGPFGTNPGEPTELSILFADIAGSTRLYESLGDEVRVEPVTPELMVAEECATCLLAACDRYVVIYTRPGEGVNEPEV